MKNFALMVVAIAFGAVMLTGCPGANNATNASGDDHKEGDHKEGDGDDHKDDKKGDKE